MNSTERKHLNAINFPNDPLTKKLKTDSLTQELNNVNLGFTIFQDEEDDQDYVDRVKIPSKSNITTNTPFDSTTSTIAKENIPPISYKINILTKQTFKKSTRKPLSSLDITKVKGFLTIPGSKPFQLTTLWDHTRTSILKPSKSKQTKSNIHSSSKSKSLHNNFTFYSSNQENKENISPLTY